jgi:predicted O-linked N-acetylglucosamine transferase (SPINDLY family)
LPGADELFAAALRLEDRGRFEEALEQYARLLAQAPQHADAWHNRGLLLARLGRLAEAEQSHRSYTRLFPSQARAHGNLADVLLALGRNDEALEALDEAWRCEPGDASVLVRRGIALACLRRFAEARQAFAAVRASHPLEVARFIERVTGSSDVELALSPEIIFLERRYMAHEGCDWSGWEDYCTVMRDVAQDPATVLQLSLAFAALHLPLNGVERHGVMRRMASLVEARNPVLAAPAARRGVRLRVGVLSPDFREHLNAYLLLPLFELLDRSRFELHAYSLAADDGSEARAKIRAAADGFHDLQGLDDRQAAAAIRHDDIDILVDAGGFTMSSRFAIAAQRPARLQASYLAFPSSLGSKRVDYAIVDEVVAPSAAEWSESLVCLPHTFFLYDFRAGAPQVAVSRAEYGLPEAAFVYCAFHKALKITPESFALWMEILTRTPGSVLWFGALPPAVQPNLRAEAARRGVDPARLVFAPLEPGYRHRYLARQRLGDLLLDAVNHNAMTTACDALGMGLPLLTLRGSAMATRTAESLLRAAGLPELVAADRKAFVEAAVRLGTDPTALAEVRARLARQRESAPLFDTAARVRDLGAALEAMAARAQRGEPPGSFNIRHAG